MSEEIVNALLEDEGQKPLDPKYFAARVPTVYDDAIKDATEQFMAACDAGRIYNARSADEIATEIVQDVCSELGMDDNEDFEEVITPLYKMSAEMFPGNW